MGTHDHDAEHEAAAPKESAAARGAAPRAPLHANVLALQRQVGNAAVTQILARQDPPVPSTLTMRPGDAPVADPGWSFSPFKPIAPGLGTISQLPPPAVNGAIRTYLGGRSQQIHTAKVAGTITMGQLVADIKKAVPGAADCLDFQLETAVSMVLGPDTPPGSAADAVPKPIVIPGLSDKLAELFKGKSSSEPLVTKGPASLDISLSGVEVAYKPKGPGASTVTATAGPGGVEIKSTDKGSESTLSIGYGDSVGFKTKTPDGSVFEATIAKDDGGAWAKWSISLSVPLVGKDVVEARPPVDEIIDSVNKGYGAAVGAIGAIAGGASPTSDAVKGKFKDVKPAIENLGKAVEKRTGPNVTFKFGAEGAPVKDATGTTQQRTFIGASLVVEF